MTKNESEQADAKNATIDTQAQIDALAGKTAMCHCCTPDPPPLYMPHPIDSKCKDCEGTGQVASFPSLRRECRDCAGTGNSYALNHPDACDRCEAKGWLPVALAEVDLNALLMEIANAGLGTILDVEPNQQASCTVYDSIGKARKRGDTPTEAVVAALFEAVRK